MTIDPGATEVLEVLVVCDALGQGQEGPSPENPGCTQGGPGRSGGVQQVPSPACYAAQGLSAAHIVEAWSWERT
eukprot:scaffold222871_cov19-Tisochrysis_lutea.AAC.2